MNIQEHEIIKYLGSNGYGNQRELAAGCSCSLGMVNRCLKSLENLGFLSEEKYLTESALQLLKENRPERAVILAAGIGMRMVPVNMEHPKAMLEVNGEILIERLIRQLQAVGIREIYIVVGFMKEAFEYLIDAFGVKLIVNRDYASYNNLHSLVLTKDKLRNAYILPSDVWCKENPFSRAETYSWYMVKDSLERGSEIRANRKRELVRVRRGEQGNPMVGISYITKTDGQILEKNLETLSQSYLYDHAFWEEALYQEESMLTLAKVVSEDQVIEINTYRQLQELKRRNSQRKKEVISFACRALKASAGEIQWGGILKKGITNQSVLITCRNRRYVLRVSNQNPDPFVDRFAEQTVYHKLKGKRLSDDVIAIDATIGCKLTKFLENSRACCTANHRDLKECMAALRRFHNTGLKVPHETDLFERILFYESLWQGKPSAYRDYEITKENVFSLQPFIEAHKGAVVLTHLDAVPDNFLFYEDADGEEKLRLIDWEYAAMQDPHVDIAMFCISALFTRKQVDNILELYFENSCSKETRIKIYCYMAVCGLMWSNWCEYQLQNGAEFGEYSLKQYRYAKEFFRYAAEEIKGLRSD